MIGVDYQYWHRVECDPSMILILILILFRIRLRGTRLSSEPDEQSLARHLVHPEDYLHSESNTMKSIAPMLNYTTTSSFI